MPDHPNAVLARKIDEAFSRGDMQALDGYIADDVIWHEIGRAEPRRGKVALRESSGAAMGDYQITARMHDVVANDDHTVVLVDPKGEIANLADGCRSVIALPPDHKWITLIDWTTLETARIDIAAWQRLTPHADRSTNPRKVRAFMRRRLKYAAPTQAIKQALSLLKGTAP